MSRIPLKQMMEVVKEQEALVRHYENTAGTDPSLLAQKKAELYQKKQELLVLAENSQDAIQGRDHLFGSGNVKPAQPTQQETERDRRLRLRAEERARRLAGETSSVYAQAEAAKDQRPPGFRDDPIPEVQAYSAPYSQPPQMPGYSQPQMPVYSQAPMPTYSQPAAMPAYAQPYQRQDYPEHRAHSQEPLYQQPYSPPERYEMNSRPSYSNEPPAYRAIEPKSAEPETYHPMRDQPRTSLPDSEGPGNDRRRDEYTGLMLGADSDQRKLEQKRRLQEEYAEYLRLQQPKSRQAEAPSSGGGAFVLGDKDDKAEKQRRYREALDMQLQTRQSDSSNDSRSTANSRDSDGLSVGEREQRRLELERKRQYAEELKAQMQSKQKVKQQVSSESEPAEGFESITRPPRPKNDNQVQYRMQLQAQIEEKKRREDEEKRRREHEEMREEQRLRKEVGNPDNKPIAKVVTKDPNAPSEDNPNAERYKQLMVRRQVSDPEIAKGRPSDYYKEEPGYAQVDLLDVGPPTNLIDFPQKPQPVYNYPPQPAPVSSFPPASQPYMPQHQAMPYQDNYYHGREIQEMQRERERSKEQLLELKEAMLREKERALNDMAKELQSRVPGYYPPQSGGYHYPQQPLQISPMYYPQQQFTGYQPQPAGYMPPQQPQHYPNSSQIQPAYPPAYPPSYPPIEPTRQDSDDNIISFSNRIEMPEETDRFSEFDKLPTPQYVKKPDPLQDIRPSFNRTPSATFNADPQIEARYEGKAELLKSREIVSKYHAKAVKGEEPPAQYLQETANVSKKDDLFEQSLSCETKWVDPDKMKWGATKLYDSVADFNALKVSQSNQRKGWGQSTEMFKSPQPLEKQSIDATPRFNMHQLMSTQEFEESLPNFIIHVPFMQSQDLRETADEISEESVEEEAFIEEEVYADEDLSSKVDESCTVQVGMGSDSGEADFAAEIAKNFEEAEESDEDTDYKAIYPPVKVRPASMSSRTKPKTLDVFKPKVRDSPQKPPAHIEIYQPPIEEQSLEQSHHFHNFKEARAKHKAAKKSTALDNIDSILERLQEPPELPHNDHPPTTASKFTRNAVEELRREQ
mmetsp:Transcript_34479/g.60555  ORF Transcript_34479/g.60555 Transcript_34479/m.60555 type:complete len:1082 (+) Transcript_34479:466-3711(+)